MQLNQNKVQPFDIRKYSAMAGLYKLGFKILPNGIQFIAGTSKVTFYKSKYHYNKSAKGNGNFPYKEENIESILKQRFKISPSYVPPPQPTQIIKDTSSGEAMIEHIRRKRELFDKHNPGKDGNQVSNMLGVLILELQQYL